MRYPVMAAVLISSGAAMAQQDWPQFGGPQRNGIAQASQLARQWPAEGPPVLWSIPTGEGFGGVAVRDDEIYILDRLPEADGDVLRCLDLQSGAERWRYSYETRGRFQYPGSRSTPTVTETHVYTVGAFGHVHAFDRRTQQVAWALHMSDFDGEPPNWGYGQSPLLVDEMLIIAPMSRSTGLVALHQHTGEVIWKTPGVGGSAYTSPLLTQLHGVEQILLLTGDGLTSINPEDGTILWRFTDYRVRNAIPTPTPMGDGRIFLTGGYRAGSKMIRVTRHNGNWVVQELYRIEDGSMIHNAVLFDGYLYANLNTNENLRGGGGRRRGRQADAQPGAGPMGIACLQPNGNILWQTGAAPNVDRGPLLLADGMIISLGGQDGVLRLIEARPDAYRELAAAPIFDDPGNNLWAPMALAQGKLLVRSQHELKCIDLRQP